MSSHPGRVGITPSRCVPGGVRRQKHLCDLPSSAQQRSMSTVGSGDVWAFEEVFPSVHIQGFSDGAIEQSHSDNGSPIPGNITSSRDLCMVGHGSGFCPGQLQSSAPFGSTGQQMIRLPVS
jgi:hypothetical protein